jgi:hypothetical protein
VRQIVSTWSRLVCVDVRCAASTVCTSARFSRYPGHTRFVCARPAYHQSTSSSQVGSRLPACSSGISYARSLCTVQPAIGDPRPIACRFPRPAKTAAPAGLRIPSLRACDPCPPGLAAPSFLSLGPSAAPSSSRLECRVPKFLGQGKPPSRPSLHPAPPSSYLSRRSSLSLVDFSACRDLWSGDLRIRHFGVL